MMIDPRKPKVLVRTGPEGFEQLVARRLGVERAGGDLLEKILELFD